MKNDEEPPLLQTDNPNQEQQAEDEGSHESSEDEDKQEIAEDDGNLHQNDNTKDTDLIQENNTNTANEPAAEKETPDNDNTILPFENQDLPTDENTLNEVPITDISKLKKGMTIKCKLKHNNKVCQIKLTSRAGRAKGLYKYEYNTINEEGDIMVIDFKKTCHRHVSYQRTRHEKHKDRETRRRNHQYNPRIH